MTETIELPSKRVVVCGSMSFLASMLETKQRLQERGVRCITPEPEDEIKPLLSPEAFEAFKRKVSFKYLRAIRRPETFCVLAANFDKYGVDDYIGPNTFAEIAVAFAQSKRIYLLNRIPDMYADELLAWGAIELGGHLDKLAEDYHLACRMESLQMPLFLNQQ